jgi:Tol biopolymer transport system component/DNA-binding winged helix-turn-helix (wHTH) protein
MTLAPPGSQVVRFADVSLDLRSGELIRDGNRLLLPEQPFRILTLLLRQPGSVVTREELRREIWRDEAFVDFEHGLNAAVKRLRSMLGDSATAPRFIETLPRRGYRFIGDLADPPGTPPEAPEPTEQPPTSAPQRNRVHAAWAVVVVSVVLLGIALLGQSGHTPRTARLTRLTSTSGLNVDPALSPDGRLLAYASDRGGSGGFDIWIQPVGGGEPLQLTSDPADEAEPSFSPDGTEIVFSRRSTGLYVMGALGGTARLVAQTEWARTPRFSPDGRWIAYWTGFPATVVAGGIPDALASISLVPSAGGPARVLEPQVASARYPIWSPDGEHILFLGEENTDQKLFDWYLMNRDGRDLVKTGAVQQLAAAGLVGGPPIPGAWNRSRDVVVFSTNEADSSNLWEIPISPTTGQLTGSPRRLTFGTAVERSPAVAASGQVVFSSVVENVDVWRVPVDERTGIATGPLERVTDNPASDRLRSVSFDGKTMAFISSRTKADEVWIRDLSSGRERQVTHGGADDATLSPDGSWVVYSKVEGGTRTLSMVNTEGGPPSPVCTDCSIPGDWSPDRKHVLLGKGLPSRLVLYDLSTGEQAELTAHPKWNLHQAHFSRDAQWVAFHTTNSPNVRQVYATRAETGKSTRPQDWVPVVTDHGCHPSWSADGSLLYHFSFRDGAFCPWVQQIDPVTKRPTGPPRAVVHLHNPGLRASSGAAATNVIRAGYFYFTATEATGNIWMLDDRRD